MLLSKNGVKVPIQDGLLFIPEYFPVHVDVLLQLIIIGLCFVGLEFGSLDAALDVRVSGYRLGRVHYDALALQPPRRELVAVAQAEGMAIDGEVLAQVQLLPRVGLALVVLRKAVAADELALRDARVLHKRLVDLHGVVLEEVEDGDGAHAVELVRALVDCLLEVAVEAEDLLVVGDGGRDEVVGGLGLGAAVDESRCVVLEHGQFGLVGLVVVERLGDVLVLFGEVSEGIAWQAWESVHLEAAVWIWFVAKAWDKHRIRLVGL